MASSRVKVNFFTAKTRDVVQANDAFAKPVPYVIILLTLTLFVGHSSRKNVGLYIGSLHYHMTPTPEAISSTSDESVSKYAPKSMWSMETQ